MGADMAPDENSGYWLVMDGDYGVAYHFNSRNLEVRSSASELVYPVPNAETLQGCSMVATDGKYVYMKNKTEIMKVELLTGSIVGSLQTGKILVQNIVDCIVMYYVEYDGENFNICRAYLPEMKLDVLDSFEAPSKVYAEHGTTYIDGSMRWILFNPELLGLMEEELKNPESSYQKLTIYGQENDFSDMWTNEKFWDEDFLTWQDMFWYGVQEKSGIRAFVEYHYHMEDGTLSKRTGIIDGCSFGTGELHDHFNPEITEISGPTVINGPWQTVHGQNIQGTVSGKPSGEFSVEQCSFGTEPAKLYLCCDGYYTEFADISFKIREDREDAIYGITYDNRLVQLSYDGTVCNTLYTGEDTLLGLVIVESYIYFADGDELLELDVKTNQYRVLVRQEHLSSLGYYTKDGQPFIYINATVGMAWNQHAYNLETGKIQAAVAL